MPDVLYIHPAKHSVDAGYQDLGFYFFIPVGVIGLVNRLRRSGLSVTGINYPAELLRDRGFRLIPWLKGQKDVRLVMVDLHWYMHSYGAISVAHACRQALPDARIVLGGITASLYAAEILRSFPEIDFVIRGDAESPLLALATALCRPTDAGQSPDLSGIPNLSYRSNGQMVENQVSYCATPQDLDDLDFVDLDFLEHADQYGVLQLERTNLTRSDTHLRGHWLCIGRGCIYDCSFCGGGRESHKIFASRPAITLRSIEKVADDIQRLKEEGIDQVSPNLDPAILGPDYWRPLFAQLRSRGVRIGINNEHFQLPSREFVEDFVQTADIPRSELAFSLLSGSDKVRQFNGKVYSNSQLDYILDLLKEHQVPVYIYFSLNLPGEDEKAFRRTLRTAEQIGRRYPSHLLKMINMVHTLDPCSPMSRKPGRFSIQVKLRSFMDYYDYCRTTLDIPAGEAPWKERGFTLSEEQSRSLGLITRQWDNFCARQKFACFRVPRGW
jgi:radical SAM superfamily enzyme YgiQ (UPF0313 family)